MRFGDPFSFAVEAVPGPEAGLPRFVGRSLAGRMQIHLGGCSIGDFSEPCCVFGPTADHLMTIGRRSTELWHESLRGLASDEVFRKLDRALYLGQDEPYPPIFDRMNFLTNVSECFDDLKGFVLAPRPEVLWVIVHRPTGEPIVSHRVRASEWLGVAVAFSSWLKTEEKDHAAGSV